jgi:hypothetical protein
MRTIELPDHLVLQANRRAALKGISLREFVAQAIELKLATFRQSVRHPPPEIVSAEAPRICALTADQIDAAMFG